MMKQALRFGIGAAILLLATAQGAFAQLEVGSNGTVGIGAGPLERYGLHVVKGYDASSSGWIHAVSGLASGANPNGNIGVGGSATSSTDRNFGVYAYAASNAPGALNYAVLGSLSGGSNGTHYAGYFEGDVLVTGTFSNPSDASLKEAVQSLQADEGVLPRLMRLRPHAFVYTQNSAYAHMGLPEGEHFGLVAQEVEEVFPNLVKEEVHPATPESEGELDFGPPGDDVHYKSVNYIELVPVLIQAIQEQQAEIESQRERIAELEAALGRR